MGFQKNFYAVVIAFFMFSQSANAAQACSLSNVFSSRVPGVAAADNDSASVELGLKFKMKSARSIRGLRFYKGAGNVGSHIGNLWSASGRKLASVKFTNETASGWQTALFSQAVAAKAGTTYVISYLAPRGHYAADERGLAASVSNAALSTKGSVYRYGKSSAFPSQTYKSTNYYVDVLFDDCAVAPQPPAPPVVTPPPPVVVVPPTIPPPAVTNITHGNQITTSAVGPAAIGITSFTKISGGALYDSNASSFGVNVAGTAVYDGVTVQGPHLLIQGKEIDLLDIYSAKRIVIRGSKIRGNSYWSINVRNPANGGIFILHNDIGGVSASSFPGKGINIDNSGAGAFVYRNNITLAEDGIDFMTSNVSIVENYIHDFAHQSGSHDDGIANAGGESNIIIARNKILLGQGDTGAINVGADGGDLSNWLVDSNYIAGGGYTCYCGGEFNGNKTTNFKFTNNVFGLDFFPNVGQWGPAAYVAPKSAGNVFQGNTDSNGNPMNP